MITAVLHQLSEQVCARTTIHIHTILLHLNPEITCFHIVPAHSVTYNHSVKTRAILVETSKLFH